MKNPDDSVDNETRDALAEEHMREYFKRNDLPGPGSTHNQIFAAGWDACLKRLAERDEALAKTKELEAKVK